VATSMWKDTSTLNNAKRVLRRWLNATFHDNTGIVLTSFPSLNGAWITSIWFGADDFFLSLLLDFSIWPSKSSKQFFNFFSLDLVLILFITIFLFEIICKIKIFFLISSSNFFYFPSKYDTGRLFFIVNYF